MSIWTYGLVQRLEQAAADGKTVAETARELGLTKGQVRNAGYRYRVAFRAAGPRPAATPEAKLRARWELILPEMKAQLVKTLERTA